MKDGQHGRTNPCGTRAEPIVRGNSANGMRIRCSCSQRIVEIEL